MSASSQRSAPLLWTSFEVLVLTKLNPPKPARGNVVRTRPARLLDQAMTSRVALVQAPAGYGKTTLLAQWSAQRAEHIAWVSLDPDEYDRPDSFLAYLLAALQRVHNDLGMHARKELFERGSAGVQTSLKLLLNELTFFPEPIIIVLDDYHAVGSDSVNAVVAELCDHLPERTHLVIASRSEPGLHLSRMRVAGELTFVGARELAFDAEETRAFARLYFPPKLDAESAETITNRAQGWVAGLQMAAIALADAPPERSAGIANRLPSSQHLVEDFMVEEVLGTQSAETIDFLLQVSVLNRVHPELAEALTNSSAARQQIEWATRAQLFVISLDEGAWIRFHHLFLDVLRKRAVQQLGRQRVLELHRAAAEWFETRSLITDAIAHYIAAEDWERAAALIKPAFSVLLRLERAWDLYSWINQLPEALMRHDVEIAVGYAWALNRLGDYEPLPALLELIKQLLTEHPNPVISVVVAGVEAGIARGRGDGQGLLVHAGRAREILAGITPQHVHEHETRLARTSQSSFVRLVQRTADMQYAGGLLSTGRPIEADLLFADNLAEMLAEGDHILLSPVHGRAVAHQRQGLLREAKRFIDEGRALTGGRTDIVDYRLLMIVEADLLREWNRPAEALAALADAEEHTRLGHFRTFLPELYVTRGRVHLGSGAADAAQADFERSREAAQALGSEWHARTARAYQARLAISTGDLAAARDWAFRSRLTADSEITAAQLIPLFTFARVLIADEEHEDAIRLLEQLKRDAEQAGRGHDVIEALLLQAIAYQDLLLLDSASEVLEQALRRSAPEQFTRLYLDEGRAMTRVLRAGLHRDAQPREVRRLLVAAGVDVSGVAVRHPELTEALTPREVEVLKMIAIGLTNREISEELFISVATVKRHITNIYGKLGCTSRTLVIERARALELL